MVRDWQQSGQNKLTYCKLQGISYARFLYWHRVSQSNPEETGEGKMVSLEVVQACSSQQTMVVRGRTGVSIELPLTVSSFQFAKSLLLD